MKKLTKKANQKSLYRFTEIEETSEDKPKILNTIELSDLIQELWEKAPDGRTKEYKAWKDEINKHSREYNRRAKFRAFEIIK